MNRLHKYADTKRRLLIVEVLDVTGECIRSYACNSNEPQAYRLIQSAALAWSRSEK